MGTPCGICGDFGWKFLLVTCSKCCMAREHRYCMRKHTFEFLEDWLCEECLRPTQNNVVKPAENNVVLDSTMVGPIIPRNLPRPRKPYTDSVKPVPKWKRNPDTAKVKQISREEVIRLSSGATKKGFPSCNVEPRPLTTDSATGITRKVVIGLRATNLKPNSSFVHPKALGPTRQGALQTNSENGARAAKRSEELEGKRAYVPCVGESSGRAEQEVAIVTAKEVGTFYSNVANEFNNREEINHLPLIREHDCEKHVVDTVVEEVETSSRKKEKALISSAPLPLRISPPINCSGRGARDKNSNSEERSSMSILHKLRPCRPYLPALYATWKGGFLDSTTRSKFFGGFRAQPPCRVSKKAYNFSKKMPIILMFELLPRGDLLVDLLKSPNPDLSDVGLYFFPDENIWRSKENHAHLFKIMETHNFVIRSYLDGAELLIFTSKQLDELSHTIMAIQKRNENFLWGVFRRTKMFSPSVLPLETACCDSRNMDNQEVIDMEIDMEGGKILDDADTTFPKEKSGAACGRSEKKMTRSDLLIRHAEIGKHTFEESIELRVISAKPPNNSDENDIPPGFENISTLESRNTVGISECSIRQNLEKPEIWISPPKDWVKLNIEGILTPSLGASGSAGLVRDESGTWLFGYIINLNMSSRLSATFWALFQGLKLLWEKGYRQILVESTDSVLVDSLREDPSQIGPNKSIIKHCKKMIMKNWDCRIYSIGNGQNLCANWLANRFEEHPAGLVIFDFPPRSLIPLLENDRILSA